MSNIIHSGAPAPSRSTLAPMLYAALDDSSRQFLSEKGSQHRFADQQIIQQRGEQAKGFWLIESGSVIVGQFLPDGEFRSVARLGPGDSYGELALLANRPRVVDAVSRGESELRFVPSAALESLVIARPQAARAMMGALSAQLQELLDLIAGIRSGSSLARAAGLLANFAGTDGRKSRLAITQQEVADLLGITRATANKALRDLEHDGLISREYGAIILKDVEGLRIAALRGV